MHVKISCLLLVLSIFAGCGGSSTGNPVIAEGRAAVNDAMRETGATSISVALVDGNRVIWAEAFGDADSGSRRKATADTLYAACSVSKMLATVATMILVDQGLVDLDEPVTTYIQNFSMPLDPRYRDITVRMLLSHSSALPGNDMRGAVTAAPFPGYAAQMMDGLRYQRLKHDPGLLSAYNNDGFTMIENLVKAVTGQEYPDFVRQNILAPLGMNSSRYQTAPLPDNSYAVPYAGETPIPLYFYNVYATGGLFTTPTELSRLAMMFINRGVYGSRRILSEKAISAMAEDQRLGQFNPVPNDEDRFGLGWDTVAEPGLSAVGIMSWQKTGDLNGLYGANIMVLPEEKLGVVVFGASNSFGSGHAVKICERILLRALVARGKLAAMPKQLAPAPLPVQPVTSGDKAAFSGYYSSGGTLYHLGFSGDLLSVQEYQGSWVPKYSDLKLRSDGWYAADDDPITGVRLLTRGGRNYSAVRLKRGYGHYTINKLTAQQIPDRPAISAAWQARIDEGWLPVNADPWLCLMSKGDPGYHLRTISGLTGYLWGNKILRDMTPPSDAALDGMFVTLPDSGRDLEDARMESWGGQSWLRAGSMLYRPLSGVPLLPSGATTVVIGGDGFAEWRQLPPSGSLTISGTGYWFLYDANLNELASGKRNGSPQFSGAGAKYLILFGVTDESYRLVLGL